MDDDDDDDLDLAIVGLGLGGVVGGSKLSSLLPSH